MLPALLRILADAPAPAAQHPGLLDQFPWLGELLCAIGALALIAFFVYYLRPGVRAAGASDFRILVTPEEIFFQGDFPPSHQALVEDFLQHDCPIDGPYQILGTWTDHGLSIHVPSENAKPLEQRIRNFLKLNLKKPRTN